MLHLNFVEDAENGFVRIRFGQNPIHTKPLGHGQGRARHETVPFAQCNEFGTGVDAQQLENQIKPVRRGHEYAREYDADLGAMTDAKSLPSRLCFPHPVPGPRQRRRKRLAYLFVLIDDDDLFDTTLRPFELLSVSARTYRRLAVSDREPAYHGSGWR